MRLICATWGGNRYKGFWVYNGSTTLGPFKTMQEAAAVASRLSIITN